YFDQLGRAGRAAVVSLPRGQRFWIAAERWPVARTVYKDAVVRPELTLPEAIEKQEWSSADGRLEIVRGQIQFRGPQTAAELAAKLCLETSQVFAAFESLEGSGLAMRGQFKNQELGAKGQDSVEWCERRLLARIHRLTLDGLRRRIEPVPPEVFWQYLI